MTPAITAKRLASAAEVLIGTPFRLHGRDPLTGLDCIGLLGAAMARGGHPITLPTGYPLRLRDLGQWLPDPASIGFARARSACRAGDVVLLQPGAAQFHLAIADRSGGWIHAHAALRRVVRDAALPAGTITAHWRLRRTRK